jgi:hypothetical protein
MLLSKAETLPKNCWKSELWKNAAYPEGKQPVKTFDSWLVKPKPPKTQQLFLILILG